MMNARINQFLSDQSGAITGDWVVMTAAIVGLGLASVTAVRSGTSALGIDIQTSLSGGRVARMELQPYQFRVMSETSPIWWNNLSDRRAQAASLNNVELQHQFDYYAVHFFEQAMARGYNESCNNCRGAGNRLDLMRVQVDELARRGLVTQAHYDTFDSAQARYNARFGA